MIIKHQNIVITIDDAFEDSGDDNVTHKYRCFLGSHKRAKRVSLGGHFGRKNENHHEIYTYLNTAKAEDPDYTKF